MLEIVSRAEWGSRPPKGTPKHISIPTPELWLHHTASPSGGASRVRAIQDFHMDIRGWSDIAYSFLVNHEGTIYEGRGAGISGAHTAGHNSISHAICVMGHYDNTTPTQAAISSVVELAAHGFEEGWWPQLFTGGHRDASGANTSCPGQNLYELIPEINETLEDTMPSAEEVAQAVWGLKIKTGEYERTALQSLFRTENNVLALLGVGVSDADLEAAVDELISLLPSATLELLKQKL